MDGAKLSLMVPGMRCGSRVQILRDYGNHTFSSSKAQIMSALFFTITGSHGLYDRTKAT